MTALAAGPVQDALGDVARFVPKLVLFLIILVLGWLAARVLRAGANRLLRRTGFDQAVERGGIGRLLGYTRYDARGLVTALVYYAVLLITLQLAFGIWGPNPVSALIAGILAWLPKAVAAILIVVIATAIAAAVRNVVSTALGALSYGRLLANVAAAFIIGIGVIAALDEIGVAAWVTTPVLIAFLATAGGILVVGVGGGLVRPMQSRWESWLNRAEQEVPQVRERLRAAAEEREAARREAAEREEAARREAEERAAREAEERAAREAEERAAAEREEAARREAEEQRARQVELQQAAREEAARRDAEREEAARQDAARAEAARQEMAQREEAAQAEPAAGDEAAAAETAAPSAAATPKKRAARPRTARERAEQAAAQREAAEAGTLPQAPPSDDPTVAIDVTQLKGTPTASGQDAEETQQITLPTADAGDDPERTQVISMPEQPEQPAKPSTQRRRRPQSK